jgi:hypothetical protein
MNFKRARAVRSGTAVHSREAGAAKVARMPCPSEHVEQREFVQWWRKNRKERIYAIPNGGKRGIVTATKLKAEGVEAGVPDLHVPELRLWIEMKRQKGGVVSKEQKDWKEYLEGIGDRVIVARGMGDAVRQLEGGDDNALQQLLRR